MLEVRGWRIVVLGLVVVSLSLGGGYGPGYARPMASGPVIVEFVGHLGNTNDGVFVVGDTAYVTLGMELAVLDISDPANPRRVGYTMLPGYGRYVHVSGRYAYVGSEYNYFWIVDILDPAAPTVVGSYSAYSWAAWGVYAADGYAYVVGENLLTILDVSDPTSPTLAGSCAMGNYNWDIDVAGDYAYVAGDTGLHVVDVSDPTAPVEVGSLAAYSRGIDVAGNYVYLTDFEITVKSQLLVVDVSDPTQPQQVGVAENLFGALGPWGSLADVYVAGNYAYVSGTLMTTGGETVGGIQIVDVSTPPNPQLRETYLQREIDYPSQVHSGGSSYVLLAGGDAGLRVVEVSNPDDPAEAGVFLVAKHSGDIGLAGSYAYLSYWGLDVANVADPSNPVPVSRYEPDYGILTAPHRLLQTIAPDSMAISYPYVYLGVYSYLLTIDISDPTQPNEVSRYQVSNRDVAVTGDTLCLASYPTDLLLLDVSDPAGPQLRGSLDIAGDTFSLFAAGDYAYLANEYGLQIVDISDPDDPVALGLFATADLPQTVHVSWPYAYLMTYDDTWYDPHSTLRIVDISDPSDPTEVGSLVVSPKGACGLALSDPYLLVTVEGELHVVDVSEPAAPAAAGFYGFEDIFLCGSLDVTEDEVYVAGNGLYVLRLAALGLRIEPPRVSFMAQAGGADPPPRTVRVESSGDPLTWTAIISPTAGWLEAAPLSGTTPAVITLSARISGLTVGRYESGLVVSSPVSSDPQTVPITLIVAQDVRRLYLPLMVRE